MADNIGYGKRVVISAEGTNIGGALLEIEQGKLTDMAFHLKTDKIIHVLQGLVKVRVLRGGSVTSLDVKPGVSFYVRAGVMYQLEALEQSIVIEFVSDTELYKDHAPDTDTNVISTGTTPEEVPEAVQEGEFATMTPEDEAKVEEEKPKATKKKRTTRKKKPATKKKATKRNRKK